MHLKKYFLWDTFIIKSIVDLANYARSSLLLSPGNPNLVTSN